MSESSSYGTVLQCRHSSLELSTSALAFIKSHPLMHDCVDTLDSRPLYFTKHDEAFTRLAVDYVVQYTVFFLASSKLSLAQSLLAIYILNHAIYQPHSLPGSIFSRVCMCVSVLFGF